VLYFEIERIKMELKQSLSPKLIQKLRLTPQLKQAIHILQLNVTELRELAEHEFEENPLLELDDPISRENIELDEILDQDNMSYYLPRKPQDPNVKDEQEKQKYLESIVTKNESLQENLTNQLHLNTSDEEKTRIGESIIGNINDDGYLDIATDEIAENIQADKAKVEEILSIIQEFYPPGVGARDLKECLLIQLKYKGYSKNDTIYKIVDLYLEDLEKGKFKKIANVLKIDEEKTKELLKEIAYLEPKCGREFTNEKASYIYPDLTLQETKDGYIVEHNNNFLPTLKISNYYKKLIKDKDTPDDTKKYIEEKLSSALWLIKAINQRQNTILKVAQCVIEHQEEFLNEGEGHLKPLILKEVAQKVKMSESTISRTVTGKYIMTPYGVLELKEFFSRDVKHISADKLKSLIKSFIEKEKSQKPLTDTQLSKLLKHKGIDIARRTVAKYRDELKILPSHLRAKRSI